MELGLPRQTNRPLTVVALLLAMFLAAMEMTVVSTAMPTFATAGEATKYSWRQGPARRVRELYRSFGRLQPRKIAAVRNRSVVRNAPAETTEGWNPAEERRTKESPPSSAAVA